MKKPTTIAMLLLSFAMTSAYAANNEQPEKPRNETEICAQEAQGKSTADRYAYMKECVQRKDVEGKPSPSEETASAKKKVCTAEAKSHPTEERKKFIQQCMKKKSTVPATPASAPAQ